MRKAVGIRTAGVFLVLAGLWVASTQQRREADLETVKVTEDLYVITGSGGNIGVYLTGEGAVLIDSKFERNVAQIVKRVEALTDKPIRYVLNTHHHGDHTGGNARLMARAEVIAHENARQLMVEKKQPGLPRITFAKKSVLNLGGKEVQLHYFGRGHTNGDAVIYFPALKTIHTGDLVIGAAPFIDYSSGGSGVEWPDTLAGIARLDFETVIPGHGSVMKRSDLLGWKKSFETVISQVRRWKREGKSKEEVASLINLREAGWEPGRAFLPRSLPGLYDELQ